MTYFMRFIFPNSEPPQLTQLADALQRADAKFAIYPNAADPRSGDLHYGDDIYGELEINGADESVFSEEIQELLAQIEGSSELNASAVRDFLLQAGGMVALRVDEAGHYNADRLDPMWDWMFETRGGLLQVDDEGYYDRERLVLLVESDEDES